MDGSSRKRGGIELVQGSEEWRRFSVSLRAQGMLLLWILAVNTGLSIGEWSGLSDEAFSRYSQLRLSRLHPVDTVIRAFRGLAADMGLGVERDIFLCGSARRENIYVGDVDIIVLKKPFLKSAHKVLKLIAPKGERDMANRSIFRFLYMGISIDLYVTERESLPTMQLFLTGSKFFNVSMRSLAKRAGYKLSGQSLSIIQSDANGRDKPNHKKQPTESNRGQDTESAETRATAIAIKSEKDVFRKLGIGFVAPRYRCFWIEHPTQVTKGPGKTGKPAPKKRRRPVE